MSWSEQLEGLAVEYYKRLSTGELNRRLAHHLCHVAPELWLSQELAYLINNDGPSVGFNDWSALLEARRVDVTLLPLSESHSAEPIYLELKLVPPAYWSNWHEVYHDLACHPELTPRAGRPTAHFAVCFLVVPISQANSKQRLVTYERYRQFASRIPAEPGPFQPIDRLPPLWLEYSSPPFRADWPNPVPNVWPDGYASVVRVLWISNRALATCG